MGFNDLVRDQEVEGSNPFASTNFYLCLRPLTLSNLYSNVVPAVASWLLLTADKERAITTLPFSLTTTHSRLAAAFGGYFRGKWIERGSTLM